MAYYRDLSDAVDSIMTSCMESMAMARRLGFANGGKQSMMLGMFSLRRPIIQRLAGLLIELG